MTIMDKIKLDIIKRHFRRTNYWTYCAYNNDGVLLVIDAYHVTLYADGKEVSTEEFFALASNVAGINPAALSQ